METDPRRRLDRPLRLASLPPIPQHLTLRNRQPFHNTPPETILIQGVATTPRNHPGDERIVTVEDAAELQLHQDHVLTLESRPANIEGEGQVAIRDLVRNTLRMRPDRIVVGEVRGSEALDMLQAMNTGHDGSLTTVHSNGPRDTLSRIETMVLMAGFDLPIRAIREQVASAVNLIVHVSRLKDGTRRVTHVTEVEGMEGEIITLQDLFLFDYGMGVDDDGKYLGRLKATGIRPSFSEDLENQGIRLPADLFEPEPFARR